MIITTEQADQILSDHLHTASFQVDEYEQNELGHVYQLDSGGRLVIPATAPGIIVEHYTNGDGTEVTAYLLDIDPVGGITEHHHTDQPSDPSLYSDPDVNDFFDNDCFASWRP